jgi:hypothetical protein
MAKNYYVKDRGDQQDAGNDSFILDVIYWIYMAFFMTAFCTSV